jgi:hypothetical protein
MSSKEGTEEKERAEPGFVGCCAGVGFGTAGEKKSWVSGEVRLSGRAGAEFCCCARILHMIRGLQITRSGLAQLSSAQLDSSVLWLLRVRSRERCGPCGAG